MLEKAHRYAASTPTSANGKARAMLAVVAGLLLLSGGPFCHRAFGSECYWNGGGIDPNWTDSNNWVADIKPISSDTAIIGSSIRGGVTPATAVIGTTGEACSYLYLGHTPGDSGTVQMVQGSLTVGYYAFVGYSGTGTFTQTGGTHTVNSYLHLGYNKGSEGNYTLSDGSLNVGHNTCVGCSGTGTFTQTGGTHTVNSALHLGYYAGSEGNYTLSDGSLNVGDATYIGCHVAATFTQTGGTHTVSNLYVGNIAGSGGIGAYNLAAGRLAVGSSEQVYAGSVFTQTGGEHTVEQTVYVNAGGQYVLEGGTLTAAEMILYGGSVLHATGGTLNVAAFEQRDGTIEGTLENRGTFNYYDGDFEGRLVNLGQTVFTVDFTAANGCENYSILDVPLGRTLTFDGPGMTNFATITLGGGEVRGTQVLNEFGGKLLGKGTIGTDLANNGSLDLDGLLRVTGDFSNLGAVNISVTETLDISSALTNGGKITLSDGTIIGSGSIGNDPGGTIQGSGGVNVPVENNGGVIRATEGSPLVISALPGGNVSGGELAVAPNATLRIDAAFVNAGMVTLEGTGAMLTGGAIDNEGTIAGGGRITNPIANGGVLRADRGTLTLTGAGISNAPAGIIEVMPGSTLLVSQGLSASAGTIVMRGGTLDSAAGVTENSGTVMGYGTVRTRGLTNLGGVMVGSGNMDVIGPVVNDGVFGVEADRVATFYGDVSGGGSFPGPGSYVFLGDVNPGNSPGILDFGGGVAFTGSARLCVELADDDNSDPLRASYDSMRVAGDVALRGKLLLTWVPVPGDSTSKFGGVYDLVVYNGRRTGQFDEVVSSLEAYIDGDISYDVDLGGGWKAVQITLRDLLDGDADFDGVVGYSDLAALIGGFGVQGAGWPHGDFDLDGQVGAADYILLKTSMGRSLSVPGGVPEPATLSLLALGGLAMIRRRR